jgi:predicted CoA-binding protein
MGIEGEILQTCHIIAVVGLSPDPERHSHRVSKYLRDQGYKIVPVNPMATEVLGEKCYPDLLSIPGLVEVVDIFRRSEDVPSIIDQAIRIKAKAIWMQEGIVNEDAADRASQAGIMVVMDRCMLKEHRKLTAQSKGDRPGSP